MTQTNLQISSFSPNIASYGQAYGYQAAPFSSLHPSTPAFYPVPMPAPFSPVPMAQPSTPFSPRGTGYGIPPPSPFTLCKISGNISICAGCRNKYSKHPTPPDDLCIRHQEWREYFPTGSQTPQSRFGNTYYHFSTRCVKMRCPGFDPVSLEIPCELTLEDSHLERLRLEFHITL